MSIEFKLIRMNDIFGKRFFNTTLTLGEIEGNYEVPIYDKEQNPNGYQREPKQNRIKLIKERFLKNPSDPHSLLDNININIRSEENGSKFCLPIQGERDEPGNFYKYNFIEKDTNLKFYIVDGQTRIKGAIEAISDLRQSNKHKDLVKLEQTRVSVNLVFCDNIMLEAYIFYLINNYSKNLPSDGATRLIYEGVKKGNVEFENEIGEDSVSGPTIGRQREQEVKAMAVAEILNQESLVWGDRVKDYNGQGKGVTLKTVANSLIKPLYLELEKNKISLGEKPIEKWVFDVMEAYWIAINEIFPEAFSVEGYRDYNIMKASQAEILQRLLVKIVASNFRNKDKIVESLIKPDSYKKVLSNFLLNYSDTNNLGQPIKGLQCWKTGEQGSMGRYTSGGAKSDKAKDMAHQLSEQLNILIR